MANVIAVVDLGFGDAGKGTMVDAIARRTQARTVVRFNGGPQALHHVVTEDGKTHGFSQFGSGTLSGDTDTFLSNFMLVNPTLLLKEAEVLLKLGVTFPYGGLQLSQLCPLITPWHRALNWVEELARGVGAHGSCGMGVGNIMSDIVAEKTDLLVVGHLGVSYDARHRAYALRDRKKSEFEDLLRRGNSYISSHLDVIAKASEAFDDEVVEIFLGNAVHITRFSRISTHHDLRDILSRSGVVIFEGAQGVLLDEWYGFHPHTTWSTTTFGNVDRLLQENAPGSGLPVKRLGVLRAYYTRHGAGPFVTHDPELTLVLPELHNREDGWQKNFRCGWFDLVAARYALDVTGCIDGLAITHLDRMKRFETLKVCVGYALESSVSEAEWDGLLVPRSNGLHGIRLNPERDLVRQERLTRLLGRCRPVYHEVHVSKFLGFIEEQLGVPVVATSSGVTASDKWFAPGFLP